MKKTTYETIRSTLLSLGYSEADPDGILSEIDAELNRGAEEKAQKAALYEEAKPIVMEELSTTDKAVTITELYEALEGKLPIGMTKGKLQYAITRLWLGNGIERIEGKVNTYRKA